MGLFGSKTKSLVGLDIGSSSVKVCELQQMGKGSNIRYRLQKLGQVALPADAIVDGDIMDSNAVASAIRQVLAEQKIKAKEVAISVSGQQVMVKKVTFPLMSAAELAAVFEGVRPAGSVFATVAAVLAAAAVTAAWIPLRRALSLDPLSALREQ